MSYEFKFIFWNDCPASQHHLLRSLSLLWDSRCHLYHTLTFHLYLGSFLHFLSTGLSIHVPRPHCCNYRDFMVCFNVWWTNTKRPSSLFNVSLDTLPGLLFIWTFLSINHVPLSKQLQEVRSHQKLPKRHLQCPESSSGPTINTGKIWLPAPIIS